MAVEARPQRQAGIHLPNIGIGRIGSAVMDALDPQRKQMRERQAARDQQLGKLRDDLARPLLSQGTRIDRNTVAVEVILDDYWTTYVTGKLITSGQTQHLGDITVYNPGIAYNEDRPLEGPFTTHEVIPQSGEPQRVFVYDEGRTGSQNWSELGDVTEMAINIRRSFYAGGFFFPANPERLGNFLAGRKTPRELVRRSLDTNYLRSIEVLLDRIDGKEPVSFVIFRSPAFGFEP